MPMGKMYRKPKTKADKALQQIKSLKKRIAVPEISVSDDQATQTDISTTFVSFLLNGILRGDDQGNRDKREVSMKAIYGKILFECPSTVTEGAQIRLILLLDKEAHGQTLSSSLFLSDITPIDNVVSPLLPSARKRFQVLREWNFNISYQGGPVTKVIKFYKDLKNKKVIYNSGNTASVSDIEENALYLCACSNIAGPTYFPMMTHYIRLRYEDN